MEYEYISVFRIAYNSYGMEQLCTYVEKSAHSELILLAISTKLCTVQVCVALSLQAYHMVASALNAFHNVLLKQVMGEEWSISAYNHPLPRTEQTKVTVTPTLKIHTFNCVYVYTTQICIFSL